MYPNMLFKHAYTFSVQWVTVLRASELCFVRALSSLSKFFPHIFKMSCLQGQKMDHLNMYSVCIQWHELLIDFFCKFLK